jgi:hypothetical protein
MLRKTYDVSIRLSFKELTLAECSALEAFVEDGLGDKRDWGTPEIKWNLDPRGEREVSSTRKSMTAKKVLEIEKESGGKPCGK